MPILTPAALEFASKIYDAQRYEMGFVHLDLELAKEILAELPEPTPQAQADAILAANADAILNWRRTGEKP